MNKRITMYELLGLIKNGQAPKKIEFCEETFVFKNGRYKEISNIDGDGSTLGHYFCLDGMLNDTVEIIEEDKKIEDGFDFTLSGNIWSTKQASELIDNLSRIEKRINKKINEIIDEINKLKENINE